MSQLIGTGRRMPAARTTHGAALSLPYAPAWVAVAHPDQWALVRDGSDGWHVLPRLIRVALVPGVGGVREARDADRKRVADAREVIAIKSSQGYVEVPRVEVHAGGRDHPDYCVRYQTAQGGTHLWAWEIPEVTRGQQSVVRVDRDGHVAFLRWVMTDLLGMTTAPPDAIAGLRADLRSSAAKLAIQARTNAARAPVLDHVAAQVRSLGWADGLDLPAAPRTGQPTASEDLAALLADPETRALLEALRAKRAGAAPSTAAPPAASALVGSAEPEEAALDDVAHRAPARIPRRPTGAA